MGNFDCFDVGGVGGRGTPREMLPKEGVPAIASSSSSAASLSGEVVLD